MAYLKEIPRPKCGCGKPAKVELINYRNAPCGYFCAPCGRREVKVAEAREAELFKKGLAGK